MADLETIKGYLFKDTSEIGHALTEQETDLKHRIEVCVSRVMDSPMTTDKELVEIMKDGQPGMFSAVSQSQAYRTLHVIRSIVGNITLAGKQWQRYILVEAAKQTYQKAMDAGDFKGAAAALDKIGKYQRLDKDDETADWSSMIPPVLEPTDDYTVVEGVEKRPFKEIEATRKRYRKLFYGDDAVEAIYEELSGEEESDGD